MQATQIEKLDSVTFDELIEQQNPFEGKRCAFDLRSVKLITPIAIVSLAAACFALVGLDRHPVVFIDDPSVRSYLLRAGLVQVLGPIASFEPEFSTYESDGYESMRGSNPMLIEVTRIDSEISLPELLDQIVWVLRNRFRYKKYDAFDIATAVSEICQNTFDHNNGTCGLVAMQVYGQGAKRFLEIGVADHGLGLATTLRRNPKFSGIVSDKEAILISTKLGTSQHDDPTRGTGLFHLLEIAYKHEGLAQIRSGDAKVRFRMDKKMGWAFDVTEMPGVQIGLTLSSKGSVA